jgi:hypothetical protein
MITKAFLENMLKGILYWEVKDNYYHDNMWLYKPHYESRYTERKIEIKPQYSKPSYHRLKKYRENNKQYSKQLEEKKRNKSLSFGDNSNK